MIETIPPVASQRSYSFKDNAILLDCPVARLTLDETVSEVHKIIATRQTHQHCVVNAGKYVLMHRDPALRDIVRSCSLINADGQSVVWALKLIGRPIPERVTGIDLMERLFIESDKKNYRVYFLGATQPVLDRVIEHVKKNFPGLVVAGSQNGFFKNDDSDAVAARVSAANADILFVAMGSPKKEYWMARNIGKLNVPFCMGVGGSFDVVAGRAKRAPRWIQNAGFEWFYRYIQEPIRLWRRYWVDNFVFVYLVFTDFLKVKAELKRQTASELADKEIT